MAGPRAFMTFQNTAGWGDDKVHLPRSVVISARVFMASFAFWNELYILALNHLKGQVAHIRGKASV